MAELADEDALDLVFCIDVDGVMTDGTYWYDAYGKCLKRFGPEDADALALLRSHLKIMFVTADWRGLPISRARIERDMGYKVHLVSAAERYRWLSENVGMDRLVYMGDSFRDAPILRAALIGIAPRNASPAAQKAATLVTSTAGGSGAVAEAAFFIARQFRLSIPEFMQP